MEKNQNKKEKIDIQKKWKFLSFTHPIDWIVLGLFIISVLSNILLFIFCADLMNPVSTLLFQFLHLIFGIYFAVRISVMAVTDKTTEKQKSIAKTAIRQIRGSQLVINRLIAIVKSKVDSFKDNKMKDTLNDFVNHLESLSIGISSSEFAFKDILGEELKEENQIWGKVRETETLLIKKIKKLGTLSKKKEAKATEYFDKIASEINELKNQITTNISSLPIGGSMKLEKLKYSSPSLPSISSNLMLTYDEWPYQSLQLNIDPTETINFSTPIKEEKEGDEEKEDKEQKEKKQKAK